MSDFDESWPSYYKMGVGQTPVRKSQTNLEPNLQMILCIEFKIRLHPKCWTNSQTTFKGCF